MTNGEGKDNELKIFTMRNLPEDLRKRWKIVCTLQSKTMEQIAVEAIEKYINDYWLEQQREQAEAIEKETVEKLQEDTQH